MRVGCFIESSSFVTADFSRTSNVFSQMEEEEMLRVQIAVAKKSNSQKRPSNVDIYKRRVDSVKQHYEDQLKEMTAELAALKQEESNFFPY